MPTLTPAAPWPLAAECCSGVATSKTTQHSTAQGAIEGEGCVEKQHGVCETVPILTPAAPWPLAVPCCSVPAARVQRHTLCAARWIAHDANPQTRVPRLGRRGGCPAPAAAQRPAKMCVCGQAGILLYARSCRRLQSGQASCSSAEACKGMCMWASRQALVGDEGCPAPAAAQRPAKVWACGQAGTTLQELQVFLAGDEQAPAHLCVWESRHTLVGTLVKTPANLWASRHLSK
jgi:hypothetical protein